MAELIITAVNIFILCFCLGYFLSPMISRMLTKRKTGIAAMLSQARESREDARQEVCLYEQRLDHFDQERRELLLKAQEKARVREAEILSAAAAEAKRILDRADREAALMRAKLTDEVRSEMVRCSTAAAVRLIRDNMDVKASDGFIDETLKEMGEATWQS